MINFELKKSSWKQFLINLLIAFILITLIALVLRLIENGLAPKNVGAATLSYKARVTSYWPSQKIKIKADQSLKVKIKFQNLGSAPWFNSGKNQIFLETVKTKSDFTHPSWLKIDRPTKLFYPEIKPGDGITFEFYLKAPKINGSYQEDFILKAGDNVISGSRAQFQITVYGGQTPTKPTSQQATSNNQEIFKISTSQKDRLPLTINPVTPASYQVKTTDQVTLFKNEVAGFQIDFNFTIKHFILNDQNGIRILMTDENLQLVANDEKSAFRLKSGNNEITFCGNLIIKYQEENETIFFINQPGPTSCQPTATSITTETWWQNLSADYRIAEEIKYQEPQIRVGLFYAEKKDGSSNNEDISYLPIKIITPEQKPYQVKSIKDNTIILTQTQGEETEIDFDFNLKKYFINVANQRIAMTDSPILFSPINPEENIVFKITSWYRGPFWGQNVNDNEYFGTLEIRFNPNTSRLWLINELPMEKYLRGVAEIQDSSPFELLKAQKIAARTYALFRHFNPKYTNVPEDEAPLFTVRATQADQVYRGYNWEKRSPNTSKAVEETRGMVILYDNQPILAYYFARSDGRTRSSVEAKMTKDFVPYLISKPDPPGRGLTLLGHGVGMPQQGAKVAAEQGALFHQILRYYYNGVEIKKVY
jgi:hypothetical protein